MNVAIVLARRCRQSRLMSRSHISIDQSNAATSVSASCRVLARLFDPKILNEWAESRWKRGPILRYIKFVQIGLKAKFDQKMRLADVSTATADRSRSTVHIGGQHRQDPRPKVGNDGAIVQRRQHPRKIVPVRHGMPLSDLQDMIVPMNSRVIMCLHEAAGIVRCRMAGRTAPLAAASCGGNRR